MRIPITTIDTGLSEAANVTKKQRVCVIGAGAAGLTSAKHLADYPDEFDITVFENNSDIGGVWVYSDNTEVGKHSSIYKSLRTNSPKEIMSYPDYQNFSDLENRSSVTHETVLYYLKNYTDHFDLRQYIQFNTRVEKVTPIRGDGDWRSTKFLVNKRNLITNESSEMTFDAVMVCNGHYFDTKIPKIPGIETFPGKVIHSRFYRQPEDYNGQNVVVLGAASSGIDIATDLAKHAKTVYLSHNKSKIEGSPDNVIQVAGVVGANGSELLLKDNSTIRADAFIFCTGYNYSFPFLDKDSGIKVVDKHVTPLYKQLINIEHPKMSLVGLPTLVVYFPLFHFQAKYFVSVLQNKVKLPSKSEMLLDSKVPKGRTKHNAHALEADQWAYYNNLAKLAGFEPLSPTYERIDRAWRPAFNNDPWHFKENNVVVTKDGGFDLVKSSKSRTNE